MKRLITLALVVLFGAHALPLVAQGKATSRTNCTYTDAIKLAAELRKPDNPRKDSAVAAILARNSGIEQDSISFDSLISKFANNPVLVDFFKHARTIKDTQWVKILDKIKQSGFGPGNTYFNKDTVKWNDTLKQAVRDIHYLYGQSMWCADSILKLQAALAPLQADLQSKRTALAAEKDSVKRVTLTASLVLLAKDSSQKINEISILQKTKNIIDARIKNRAAELFVKLAKDEAARAALVVKNMLFKNNPKDKNSAIFSFPAVATDVNLQQQSQQVASAQKFAGLQLPSQSQAIDAMAIFIANRFKEEVSLTFFDALRSRFEKDTLLSALFPNTLNMLKNSDVFKLPSMGSSWQYAFATDITSIPSHIGQIRDNRYLEKNSLDFFRHFNGLTTGLREGKNIIDVIDFSASGIKSKADSLFTPYERAICVWDMINDAFRSPDTNRYWLSYSDLKKLRPDEFRCFAGLLICRYKAELGFLGFKSESLDTSSSEGLHEFENNLLNLLMTINQLEEVYAGSSNARDAGERIALFTTYWDAYLNVFESIFKFSNAYKQNTPVAQNIAEYIDIMRHIIAIEKGIEQKQYGIVLANGTALVGQLLEKIPQNDITWRLERKKTKLKRKLERKAPDDLEHKIVFEKNARQLLALIDSVIWNGDRYNKLDVYLAQIDALKKTMNADDGRKCHNVRTGGITSLARNAMFELDTVVVRKVIGVVLTELDSLAKINPELLAKTDALIKQIELLKANLTTYTPEELRKAVEKAGVQLAEFITELQGVKGLDKDRLEKLLAPIAKLSIQAIAGAYAGNVNNAYFHQFVRITSFVGDAMQARNSADLSKVIQTYAAPPGSYKVKRNTPFSVDLTAYPGLFGGVEWKMPGSLYGKGATGFTTPVGITFSWAGSAKTIATPGEIGSRTYVNFRGKYKNITGRSLSLHLNVLDIGAVVAYRIANDTLQAPGLPADVNFAQFFAPGAYYVYGFRNSPISLFMGAQFNPKLRKFGEEATYSDALRFSAGIVVDIPMLNLYYTKGGR